MTEFFTSDSHFGHSRILEYCPGRRVLGDSVEAMNEGLIARWNEKVGAGDTVYHIGDFALGDASVLKSVVPRLNGTIVLIRGNHDKSVDTCHQAGIRFVFNHLNLTLKTAKRGYRTFLRHYPPSAPGWEEKHWAEIFVCGHVHETFARRGSIINAGCDVSDYRPLTFEELLRRPITAEKPDHHAT